MRHASMLVPALFVLLAGGFVGCGGSSETLDFEQTDRDGAGGADDAGDGGTGIDEDSGPDDGGADADLDADFPPDAPDDVGGGDEPLPPCPEPSDPNKAALCLAIEPETISFVADDERLDGKGILYVALYDRPNPAESDPPLVPLYVAPGQPATGYATETLAELTKTPIRFDNLPETIYARVFFADDVDNVGVLDIFPGLWVGGMDMSNGFVDDAPLLPIQLEKGEGKTVKLPLLALRELKVAVGRSANPVGNGQGPLSVIAVDSQEVNLPQPNFKIYGLATADCVDLSGSNEVTIEGIVAGKGPYWLVGALNDFGGSDLPPGTLVSLQLALPPKVPDANKLTYPADAYTVSHSISLNFVVPEGLGGGYPDPSEDTVSCP